jgi:hypothetical protein
MVTFLSGKSTAISAASSTPVGPPPTIKIERADFIFVFSVIERNGSFVTHEIYTLKIFYIT